MRRCGVSRLKFGAIASVLVLLALSVSVLVVHNARAAAAVSTFQYSFDITGEQVVDGTGGQCVAETITITQGTVLIHGTSTQDASGNSLGTFDVETNAIGTGDITGTQYELTGTSHITYQIGPGHVYEEVDNGRIVGPGPDNGTAMLDRNHLTIDANGQVTAVHDSFSFGCA